jgi:hypothetical protein
VAGSDVVGDGGERGRVIGIATDGSSDGITRIDSSSARVFNDAL